LERTTDNSEKQPFLPGLMQAIHLLVRFPSRLTAQRYRSHPKPKTLKTRTAPSC